MKGRKIPPEFFTADELAAIIGSPQVSRQIAWLRANRIPHAVSLGGRPLVYRDRLLPAPAVEHNPAKPRFDFSAARSGKRAS